MCGIVAVIQNQGRWPIEALHTATDAMQHRGPDAGGYWSEGGVFLGHRRLSIIDLQTGAQPMLSHDGRYAVTFNGEIYNYRELRARLQEAGHRFITLSDTEVILEAYRRWGDACVKHLNGMFAFALWDREDKRLFAARDRLGIKPLCWTAGQGFVILSSTLEPLLRLSDFPKFLDYEALRDVLTFDYIPAPRTILKNVNKLMPGYLLTWEPREAIPTVKPYWEVPHPVSAGPRVDDEFLEEVEKTLDQAVWRQMVSDVPLGAFLSGGIDSSLLVALMARHSTAPVKTFSISFRGGEYDESGYAREVAEVFDTEHTVLPAEETSGEQLLEIMGRLDEPFSDPALVPTFALSVLTRQHVKVALSGDGGDEVFGGYPKYLRGEDHFKNPWYPWTRPLKWFLDALPLRIPGVGRIYHRTLTPHEYVPYGWTHYGDFPIFRKDLREVLSKDVHSQARVEKFFEPWELQAKRWGKEYKADLLMRTDLKTYLSENCLVKTDRASMMNSLEVRVPFLDELLVDLIAPLPAEAKIRNGQLKSLLLPLAQKLLPRCVWDRPKHGFTVPLERYLAKEWLPEVKQLLDWGQNSLPLFNYAYLRKLVAINRRTPKIGRELWTPLVVLMWCYQNSGKFSL
jgi:asparagine synthase (glutamine-hydrolysing)